MHTRHAMDAFKEDPNFDKVQMSFCEADLILGSRPVFGE